MLIYLRDGATGLPVQRAGQDSGGSESRRVGEWRKIGLSAQILRDLGISSIKLIPSSPRKYVDLSGLGIAILAEEGI